MLLMDSVDQIMVKIAKTYVVDMNGRRYRARGGSEIGQVVFFGISN